MSDTELHPSLYWVNTEQAAWGVSQNNTRYISRGLSSVPQVQLRSCALPFPGESDKVSIAFNYDLNSNLQDKNQLSFTILIIVLM